MFFQQIAKQDTGCLTYMVGSQQTKECAVIDPLDSQVQHYLAVAKFNGMSIKYVIDTHTHADHLSGIRKLANQANAQLMLSASSRAEFDHDKLYDKDTIKMGEVTLKVIAAPGHTMDSIMLLVNNELLLSGDTLLVGGCGRADFPLGISSMEEEFKTVQRIKALDAAVIVYPAHFGPIHGLDNSKTQTRLRDELRANELLQAKTKEEFKELALQGLQPVPKKFIDMMKTNLEKF